MLKQVVLGVAMCVASADAMFHGGGQWQTLEVVPQSAVRVIQPRRGARPGPFRVTPRQQMLACGEHPVLFSSSEDARCRATGRWCLCVWRRFCRGMDFFLGQTLNF